MAVQFHPDLEQSMYPLNLTWVPSHPQESLNSPPSQAHDQATPMYDGPYREQIYGSHATSATQGPGSQLPLVDLGFAAQGSRLHERWSAFMQDSGVLEGIGLDSGTYQ